MSATALPNLDSPNFCPELWQRAFVLQLNSEFLVKPCCYASPSPSNQVRVTDSNKIFETYNQSPQVQKMRSDNFNQKLDAGCQVCLHEEKVSGVSGRTRALEQARSQSNQVTLSSHVDLNLGNLCNLACAICDPNSSTSWSPVHMKMYNKEWGATDARYKKNDRPMINDPEWFANIQVLQLQGGEVFMQRAYTEFFANMQRYRDLKEIEVRIFTNGTVLPDTELFALLSQCKYVSIFFSIDDMGTRFEYQRHGGRWSQVLDNLKWFIDNCGSNFDLGIHPTYSLLNVYYLAELQQFFAEHFPRLQRKFGPYHIGTGPCSAHALPSGIKQAIVDRLQHIPELAFLSSAITADESYNSTEFLDYISKYNSATNNSYADTHPEFWKILTA
jgi:hypothetical protein